MDWLKDGNFWSNGLVGSETVRYKEGEFICEFMDIREPEIGSIVCTYEEGEFRAYLQDKRFVNFVQRGVDQRLEEWETKQDP